MLQCIIFCLEFWLGYFPSEKKISCIDIILLSISCFYKEIWVKNIELLGSLKVNFCHVATPRNKGHFCLILISDFMECDIFSLVLWLYTAYIYKIVLWPTFLPLHQTFMPVFCYNSLVYSRNTRNEAHFVTFKKISFSWVYGKWKWKMVRSK